MRMQIRVRTGLFLLSKRRQMIKNVLKVTDFTALIGFSSACYGLFLIYEPAAFILGGVGLVLFSIPSKPKAAK
jgi:hypothetical protein